MISIRINGREIKDKIKNELCSQIKKGNNHPHLAIISVGDNPIVRSFVGLKKKFAEDIDVIVTEEIFPLDVTLAQILKKIGELNNNIEINGIIIQLPLPETIDTNKVLNSIALEKDVDVLSQKSNEQFKYQPASMTMPPVIAAIAQICRDNKLVIRGQKVLILGSGRLVGAPAEVWFKREGGEVVVVDRSVSNLSEHTRDADIIVCGTGVPAIITPEMVKQGVILFDAGASEEGGVIVGDVDQACEEKSSMFTPVPGGIGPITVAMIFRNLNILIDDQIANNRKFL